MRKGRRLLVAVKILRPDASKNARFVTSYAAQHGLWLQHGSQLSVLFLQLISSFTLSHVFTKRQLFPLKGVSLKYQGGFSRI